MRFDIVRYERENLTSLNLSDCFFTFLQLLICPFTSLLFETCESDEVEDKKTPCFTESGWVEGERIRHGHLFAFLWLGI